MIDIRKELFLLKDDKYKEFQSKLLPKIDNFIGVRVPLVRKLLKKLSEVEKLEYVNDYKCEYLEEYLLKGLIISTLNDINKVIKYIDEFVPFIDNWEVCDTFVSSLKIINENKDLFYKYIEKNLNSNKEFEKRFGLVVLLNYYVEDNYIDDIINILKSIKCNYYYDKMAEAWLIQVCYVKYSDKILSVLHFFDEDVYNISKRKILDSNKVSEKSKDFLRKKPCSISKISI